MPEGPELAVSRDLLRKNVLNEKVVTCNIGPTGRWLKTPPAGYQMFLTKISESQPVLTSIETHGKFMWWEFEFPTDKEKHYMFCTYGMSGQWFLDRDKHTSFCFYFENDKKLFFNDIRNFGTIKFVRGENELKKKIKTLGPCVLGDSFTYEIFVKQMTRKSKRNIAETFLDQSAISGIGNYLRCEILYFSRISPWRAVGSIKDEEWRRLFFETKRISSLSYESQGASIKSYKNINGELGKTQFEFAVYSKHFCANGYKVIREKDSNGRTVHWCREYQY